ncbi:hypothetical protein [Halobacteriovorax sp. JY17]|uniref:hypothetical protein n=1 Tax=Halobacteriovorax sp. JY17 TaxID=2014617 RepID=UPI000C54C42C|nr:hypothetical protein [Halobacteriovorax sp. JY17]PIK16677.1 MAG: hypothetical protein CES88_08005 [Halobacteriovorax sp. JY17]
MITLLYLKNLNFSINSTRSRTKFLPRSGQVVKVLIVNCLILLAPNAVSSCNQENTDIQFIHLAIGEYRKIPVSGLVNYATSNKELISIKHYAAKESLMIRAKQQGHSSLKVWRKGGVTQEFNIFIHTKVQISKARMTLLTLNSIGLKASLVNSTIMACGEIKTLQELIAFSRELEKVNKNFEINNQTQLSENLQKEIANLIYGNFIKNKITNVSCKFDSIPIKCKLPKSNYDLKSITDYWLSDIPIIFIQTDEALLLPNYKLKTRLILLESASSEVLSLGLNKISNNLYALLKKDLNSFIGENLINFENKNIKLSSIATPELMTRINNEGEISIGSEIPFTQGSNDEFTTNWKFAGLKLKTKIEKENDQFFLNIETELSRPISNGANATISSNRTKSRVRLQLNESLQIVDIGHQGIQSEDSSLPYLSRIPILGRLFSSTSEIETFKNIKLFVQLERFP